MSNKVKFIENYENICFKCLEEKPHIKEYSLHRSEYSSSFDNYYTYLQLCDDCKPEGIEEWFDETPEMIDGYCADYKHEGKIIDFIDTFPLEGQELFWNRVAYGACADTMDSQDWIDDKLGILPDEVYEEEYDMYSPRQIKAYEENFPTCEHPINIIYDDDSKGCKCPFGSFGKYNQELDGNIWDSCFECENYKKRETPIKEMTEDLYDKHEMYMRGKQFNHLFE